MDESAAEKLLKSARTFLARWQGAPLRIEPRKGPPGLQLILSRDVLETKNLVLFLDPVWRSGDPSSSQSCLAVELVDVDGSEAHGQSRYTRLFRISDTASGFECLTEWFEMKENVALRRER